MSSGGASSSPAPLTPEQQQLYQAVQEQMRVDGTREQLKLQLKDRLVASSWKKELTAHCQALIYEKELQHVTVEELVMDTQRKAKELVPNNIRKEMIDHIRQTLIDRME